MRRARVQKQAGLKNEFVSARSGFYIPFMRTVSRLVIAAAGLAIMVAAQSPAAGAPDASSSAAGITDAEIRDVVGRVARRQIHPLADGSYAVVKSVEAARAAKAPEGIAWNYPWGVALYGLGRSADVTGDGAADKFVVEHNLICSRYYEWLSSLKTSVTNADGLSEFRLGTKLKNLVALGTLDSCGAMGTEFLESMSRHAAQITPPEQAVVKRVADWVVRRQPRMADGTLWRPDRMGGTVWPDDLYMGAVFLAHWGQYAHDRRIIDDAANQIIHQAALEADTDGLWFHGYFVSEKKHAPFKWGRGNGWVTMALVETLSVMPDNDPLRPKLIEILRHQIEGLKKVQAPDGMWRQVLDHPELWEETSCTAMFAYGIARAVNRGWIDPSNMAVARKAFAGIAKRVGADGAVQGTCQGTSIGTNLDYYIHREHAGDDPHGWGPVMLAGTEILLADKK
jgi:rhamnogalacturonyl hydrolase YesR